MTTQDQALRIVREALAEESWRLDEAERDLVLRKTRFKRSLGEFRSACGHAEIVEVRRPPAPPGIQRTSEEAYGPYGHIRFCLGCGSKERSLQRGGQGFVHFSYLTAKPIVVLAERDLGHLDARLHVKARFDEFDAKGAWCGKDDGHIQKGED